VSAETTAPVRTGLVGFGEAGEVFHAPLIDATDGLELSVVMTGDADRAGRVARDYPRARVVPSMDAAWDEIDLLVVASPSATHGEWAAEATRRGVAAVIDKPLAMTTREAEKALVPDARLTVFQNRRWDADFLTLRALIAEEALGRIFRLESRAELFAPEIGAGWREASEGGGILIDFGAHLVDQAMLLFGPPLTVYAELGRRRPGAKVEDEVFLSLGHAYDVVTRITMSLAAPAVGHRFQLNGTGGVFTVDGTDPQRDQLADGVRPGADRYGIGEDGTIVTAEGHRAQPLSRGSYDDFYAGVVAWLRDGSTPPVDPRSSVAVLGVLDAARQSAAEGQVVALAGDGPGSG